ncbi:NAD(P)/FAD-dependent oxidoreductase, partial [Micromonospora sp. NPDC049799]|uniref:flavin monoamine oxidase family protein n=1 Tax=Micromonospora sp. NPDC049799 TaxID=3154741 RepID=UPI0033E077E0
MVRSAHVRLGDDDYLDEAERRRRSRAKQEEVRRRGLTPDWFLEARGRLCLPDRGVRVAIVGAGFAGLMAAWYLDRCGVQVTVFEASNRIGGRVVTDRTFVRPHYVEAGAELIGENHPLWLDLAARFHLPLEEISEYPDARLRFQGRDLTAAQRQRMDTEVAQLQRRLGALAVTVSETEPWLDPSAPAWDRLSVDQGLALALGGRQPGPLARQWFAFTLGNDNCAPTGQQSFLGLIGSISAARMGSDTPGMRGYWLSTETHRCVGGNDLLGTALAADLHRRGLIRLDTAVTAVHIEPALVPPVAVTFRQRRPGGQATSGAARFDHVVLTAPPTVWSGLTVTPPFPAGGRTLTHGPAVKFITRYPTRFWEQQQAPERYPGARWDEMGSLWEGTDNQGPRHTPPRSDPAQGPFALSVFSGGQYVRRQADYPGKVATMFPHGQPAGTLFVNWPAVPHIMTGYAVPTVGQAARIFPAQLQPHHGHLYFAGEQTSPGFFGYMEGALQSGGRAARDIVRRVAVPCPTRLARGSDYRGG